MAYMKKDKKKAAGKAGKVMKVNKSKKIRRPGKAKANPTGATKSRRGR